MVFASSRKALNETETNSRFSPSFQLRAIEVAHEFLKVSPLQTKRLKKGKTEKAVGEGWGAWTPLGEAKQTHLNGVLQQKPEWQQVNQTKWI